MTSSTVTEQRALAISKWGNLFMGAAGVLAAWASNSQALLVDGLFSLIGFTAAIYAGRVSKTVGYRADHKRPLGYAADESLYTTFRALSLLGLIAFAFGAAVLNIVDYATGGDLPELRYGPIAIYFTVICIVCFGLAANHYFAWKKTGQQSDVLRLEANAAFFDGIMTVAAGTGLMLIPLLKGTALDWITPIGDSVIVLLLCGLVVGRYLDDFRKGVGELAGVSAAADELSRSRTAVEAIFVETGGRLVDFSLIKIGRSYQAQVYFLPQEPITAETVDDLTRRCDAELLNVLGPTTSVILISCHGRVLGVADQEAITTRKPD